MQLLTICKKKCLKYLELKVYKVCKWPKLRAERSAFQCLTSVIFRVFGVVDLGGRLTAVHAGPVVAFKHHVAFALPGVGFQVHVAVVITPALAFPFKPPAVQQERDSK